MEKGSQISRCWTVTALFVAIACGGESEDRLFEDDAGGAGSGGSDGSVNGTGGSADAGGGRGGSGGAAGSGGSAGTGGTNPVGSCAAPTGANQAAICLTFAPEQMTFENDAAYDGSGVFAVHVFDIPNPPNGTAGDAIALYQEISPANATTGGEISLSALPSPRIVLDGPPSTVYIRAIFVDNVAAIASDRIAGGGVWIGGTHLTEGLVESPPLDPHAIQLGQGTSIEIGLNALRRLDVTVTASATPVGDGEGQLAVVALDSANVVGGGARTFGIGTAGCVDIADAPIEVTGVVLGAGPYWVTGSLNDFGFQEDFPPGSLWALDADLAAQTAVIVHRLDIAAGDYTPSIAIDLNFAVPLSADAAAPGPNSCADFATDAGAP